MRILRMVLRNPLLSGHIRYKIELEDGILNENINDMSEKVDRIRKNDDTSIISIIKRSYPNGNIEHVKDVNTFHAILHIEEKLAEYKNAILYSIPEVSSSIFVVYDEKLDSKMNIPFLHYVSNYIDFLYCVYSYLII